MSTVSPLTRDEKPSSSHSTLTGERPPTPIETGVHKSHIDRNSIINIILLFFFFSGIFVGEYWLCLLWFIVLGIDDIITIVFGHSGIFDTEVGVQRGYQFAHIFLDNTSGFGRDLGFNLYDGNLDKTYDESQRDKWDYMINKLGLQRGSKLCDVGCGYGDWLNYAQSKGIEAVGINITPEQAKYAQATYGLEIYTTNWKDIFCDKYLCKKLYNRFDVITFMDTVEHYVHGKYRKNISKQGVIYNNMFKLANNMLNGKSCNQRVFISCLHQTASKQGKWSIKAKISSYFLTRYHSGFYPVGKDGLTKWSKTWFNIEDQSDKTEDYRLTAILDNNQFQAPKIKFTITRILYGILLFILDPHHIHKWIDIYSDSWMNLYGDDVYSKEYNTEKRAKTSYVALWWITLRNLRVNLLNQQH